MYEYLPAELHYLILQHLEFDLTSLALLRAANKWFYDFLAIDNIIDDILVWEKRFRPLTVRTRNYHQKKSRKLIGLSWAL